MNTRLVRVVSNIPLIFVSAPYAKRIVAILSFPLAAAMCWCIDFQKKRVSETEKPLSRKGEGGFG